MQTTHARTQQRIEKRKDVDDDWKKAALKRADDRLSQGVNAITPVLSTKQFIPVVVGVDGYFELFAFWWEQAGKYMPDADLQRIFHAPLMYAKKLANQKDNAVFFNSDNISYESRVTAA